MLRPLLALVVASTLAACGSSAATGDPGDGRIPTASARWSDADAVTIARHIPGCAHITRPAPRNDLERMMASLASCTLDGSVVLVEDAPRNAAADVRPGSDTYVVAGFGWSAEVGDRDAAQHVADALGGLVVS